MTSQVATANRVAAVSISSMIQDSKLNSNFLLEGLPQATIDSIEIISVGTASSKKPIMASMVGALIACLAALVFFLGIGYVSYTYFKNITFRAVLAKSNPGDQVSSKILPLELRKHYIPVKVLGEGAFGCVLHATYKTNEASLAIKMILPIKMKSAFDQNELDHLLR